tara:strand:+ start:2635 stop:3096 length:462 start_codon:yes stop_codon:yes gene_type:complete
MAIESNKLIAEFMGVEFMEASLDGDDFNPQFHTSWDWLMPVVQKCYKIDNEEGFDNLVDAVSTLDIDSTYKAVIEFIKEYSVSKEEIKEFIEQWGQSPEEIKNNLEEIYDYEIKADDDFILNTRNYKWCEEYAVWITDNYETQSHNVYKHLGL